MEFFLLVTSIIFGWIAIKSLMLIYYIRGKNISIESYQMYSIKAVFIASAAYALLGILAVLDFPVISTTHEHLYKMWPFVSSLLFFSYLHALEVTVRKQQ